MSSTGIEPIQPELQSSALPFKLCGHKKMDSKDYN